MSKYWLTSMVTGPCRESQTLNVNLTPLWKIEFPIMDAVRKG
jgi:hypothetical protein